MWGEKLSSTLGKQIKQQTSKKHKQKNWKNPHG